MLRLYSRQPGVCDACRKKRRTVNGHRELVCHILSIKRTVTLPLLTRARDRIDHRGEILPWRKPKGALAAGLIIQ
jgi:hypothetical protein